MSPAISIVIPVYNEQEGLPLLFERLYAALDALGRSYEVVFVDDGSTDRSVAVLREQFERRPDVTASTWRFSRRLRKPAAPT